MSESRENRPEFKLEYLNQLGGIVRDYREGQNLSVFHFGGRCGVSGNSTLSNIEGGAIPNLATFINISLGMSMEPQALLDEMVRRALLDTKPSADA